MRPASWVILLRLVSALAAAGPAAAAQTRAFVITTDFTTGGLSVVDLDTRAVLKDVATVHSDARIRWYQGLLYVLNRIPQDNVQVIDPAQGYATLRQFSVGNGSNPADIAFLSPTKAYVSRYGSPDLLVVNPATGAPLDTISLAAFADADGVPDMDHVIRVGTYLFVALQRLTGFQPVNPSQVAVIDVSADTVLDVDPLTPGKQAIALSTRNPITAFGYDRPSGRLLLGCVGAYGANDGGIEYLDPFALRSAGLAITEAALGGDVLDLDWGGAARSHAIVSDASFNTCLVAWSAVTGTTLGPPIVCPGGFSLADCAANDRGELYLANGSFTGPGVFVYPAAGGAALAGPLDTGLPPNAITFDEATDAATGIPPGGPGRAGLSPPRPNPARGLARFTLRLEGAARVRVEVFDVSGRRVRELADGPRVAGVAELEWDLRDEAGRAVPSGIYLVSARVGPEESRRRVVVVR